MYVIENGKGPAIQLVFEPGTDNKPGHYGILSNDNIKNPDYHIDPNKQNCWLDAVVMQIPSEKLAQLGGTDGILKKGMDHMNANPDVYNQLCETRNQLRQIDSTKLLEGGVTEMFNPYYWKALSEGNTKQAQAIQDQHQNLELLTLKTITNFYANLPILDTLTLPPYILYNPKGAVKEIIRIVDETSSRLSDDLNTDYSRVFIEGKQKEVLEDLKYQLPIFGNYKCSKQEYKKGNYLKSFGYGALGTVEGLAITGGIWTGLKGVRTVSKLKGNTVTLKPSGLGSTATTSTKNLIKQGGVLKNGYYEINGLKFSEYYYNKLWSTGRGAPSLIAKEVLKGGSKTAVPDLIKKGFNKYAYGGWEMVYNPTTKEVWHLKPIKA